MVTNLEIEHITNYVLFLFNEWRGDIPTVLACETWFCWVTVSSKSVFLLGLGKQEERVKCVFFGLDYISEREKNDITLTLFHTSSCLSLCVTFFGKVILNIHCQSFWTLQNYVGYFI